MEWVHLDFIGPLPRTERGNEHILMMVDQFTKWVECIPLPSQSAEETARAAVNQFFSRFGCPFQVFTDQGGNFESSLFRQAAQSPYPTSSYWVCTLCFYLQRTLVPLPTAVSIYPSSADFFQ
jgi:hypothetical protein